MLKGVDVSPSDTTYTIPIIILPTCLSWTLAANRLSPIQSGLNRSHAQNLIKSPPRTLSTSDQIHDFSTSLKRFPTH